MSFKLPWILVIGLPGAFDVSAADWAQLLGPSRNGVYEGAPLIHEWTGNGPPVVWQKSIGHGFSGPAVTGGRLILFHRLGDQETVDCLDARTGQPIWNFAYRTPYEDDFGFDNGPRATPTIADRRVYTFGAAGMLHCLELETGKKLWSVDVQSEFQAAKGFFGMACSPLIEGDLVLLNIGGTKGAGVVAFDKSNGKLRWKASEDEAGYSSPLAATVSGQRLVLFLTRNGFLAVDPTSGGVRYRYPWHSRNTSSVNAATPLVVGDMIFLSACYGTGAIFLRLHGQEIEKVWSGDDLLSNHYATSVEYNGSIYGIHGRTDPGFNPGAKLRCIDLKTRTVRWETDSVAAATIIRANDRLLILTEKGELIDAPATPLGFQPSSRGQILSSQVRAFPALADGFFYARSTEQMVCLDLRGPKTQGRGN
jgi:outer membrane protein assembly factor BamB